ncbi:hypothetical protein ACFCXG_38740, partial [Streptomyces sp. NPDC056295]
QNATAHGDVTMLADPAAALAVPVAVVGVLDRLGTVTTCGSPGTGAALKLVLINAVIRGVALIGEVLTLADSLSLPRDLALQAEGLTAVARRAAAGDGSGAGRRTSGLAGARSGGLPFAPYLVLVCRRPRP